MKPVSKSVSIPVRLILCIKYMQKTAVVSLLCTLVYAYYVHLYIILLRSFSLELHVSEKYLRSNNLAEIIPVTCPPRRRRYWNRTLAVER